MHRRTLSLLLLAIALPAARPASAQQFTAHNSQMAALQPAFIAPLVAPDPRLLQYARASFSNQYTADHKQTVNYGNGRGVGLIAGKRFEFDYAAPAYIQHNSSATDGFGDTTTLVKYRIASGNAQHGNFAVSAMLSHSFATGSNKNGALTDVFCPTLAAGRAFGPFDFISSLGGSMPTGKIAAQGRSIVWNAVTQVHVTRAIWFEIENNATFYFSGKNDGKTQNFVTPAAFYVLRPKSWKPTHPFFIVDAGMQIATSGFHTYNHNTISEVRILF